MKDLSTLKRHPTAEQITDILCKKPHNKNRMLFKLLVNYHLSKLAGSMRGTILSKDRGEIAINMYAINLASSGQGKGHSTNIIEDQITQPFWMETVQTKLPFFFRPPIPANRFFQVVCWVCFFHILFFRYLIRLTIANTTDFCSKSTSLFSRYVFLLFSLTIVSFCVAIF